MLMNIPYGVRSKKAKKIQTLWTLAYVNDPAFTRRRRMDRRRYVLKTPFVHQVM